MIANSQAPRSGCAAAWLVLLGLLLGLAGCPTNPPEASEQDTPVSSSSELEAPIWHDRDAEGRARTHLYFFWSASCSHCRAAKPIVEDLEDRHPWLVVHSHEISDDPASAQRYVDFAASLGEQARYVPAFAYCETLVQGSPGADELEQALSSCHAQDSSALREDHDASDATLVTVPGGARVDVRRWSLPITTLVIAGLDAFNPCAFFVLLVLLGLLVRSRSRGRMVLISSIFVVFSGLWYFVFMAAWLNVFLWFGELRWVTLAAGVVAVVMALFNIKEFFAPELGPSLKIPESAKPSLFARMRRLVRATSLPSAVLGTLVLAAAANTYELLCTAGLPMLYTRVLTLADLSVGTYYLYLALYNVIYVVPLVVIVAISIWTLGSRKLQEREGRALELLSGLMMLGLGLALLFAPELLSRLGLALGLLAGAVGLTAILVAIDRRRGKSKPRRSPAQIE